MNKDEIQDLIGLSPESKIISYDSFMSGAHQNIERAKYFRSLAEDEERKAREKLSRAAVLRQYIENPLRGHLSVVK